MSFLSNKLMCDFKCPRCAKKAHVMARLGHFPWRRGDAFFILLYPNSVSSVTKFAVYCEHCKAEDTATMTWLEAQLFSFICLILMVPMMGLTIYAVSFLDIGSISVYIVFACVIVAMFVCALVGHFVFRFLFKKFAILKAKRLFKS